MRPPGRQRKRDERDCLLFAGRDRFGIKPLDDTLHDGAPPCAGPPGVRRSRHFVPVFAAEEPCVGPWRCVVVYRLACRVLACAVVLTWASAAMAQTWSAEQQEIWKLEEKQWQMAKDKDLSWIETMVHPNLSYWGTDSPVPQTKASLARWNRYDNTNATVLEQELFPLSITVTANIAVVSYRDQSARESYK
jgi:hypothetical protein